MKKLMNFFLVIVSILLLVLLVSKLVPYLNESHRNSGLTEVEPKINALVIGKMGESLDELFDDLENGKAWLLLWIEKNNGTQKAYTFNTLESLVRLEQNKLGFLEPSDPGLKGLYIAKYNKKKGTLLYTPIQTQNISAIEVSRNYLIGEVLSDPKNYKKMAGTVIFLNGSKLALCMIKIPQTQVEGAKLAPQRSQSSSSKIAKK